MDDCTKVLVYGSFDGFARSTDSSILISVVLDGGEKVEIPEEFIVSADQMVNKYKIKLKDVIARIEKFDLATKAVWINEILNELGSEYGAFKYKAGYEQGKFDGAMEHEKVTIPQFVADWITNAKTEGLKRKNSLGSYEELFPSDSAYSTMFSIFIKGFAIGEVRNWVAENTDTFALAWINGYEVEKEKRYTIKMKAVDQYLVSVKDEKFLGFLQSRLRSKFTRKELEEAGFGWVFDSPGVEVEEVEE